MTKRLRQLMLAGVLSVAFAGNASAIPIDFQLDSVTTVGAAFAASQTYVPDFPITGSGNIDFVSGTGTLTLIDYSIIIDVLIDSVLDAQIDIAGWTQTITAIDGLGNITSTGGGTSTCTVLGGIGGFVCPSVSPVILGWPPADGASLASSAVIDEFAQTITVIDNSNSLAGTITQVYSYTLVPEPGTALLLAAGLVGFSTIRRRLRA